MGKNAMRGPLSGIKVLDLTLFQNGPFGTLILGDLGADVIKVEDPVNGDPGRKLTTKPHPQGQTLYFEAMNRNKRAMTLDLKKPEGKQIFYHMVKTVDVVVQNYRHGVADRLGIDYETLAQYNPKIICASVTGFGRKGPDAERGLMDILGQARSGAMKAMVFPDEPLEYQGSFGLADQTGAIALALSIMAALLARERLGIGQDVEVSQLGAQMMLQHYGISWFLATGEPPVRIRRTQARNALFNIYQCQDKKWIALSCIQSDRYWHDFCRVAHLENIEHEERLKDHATRRDHGPELVAILDPVFMEKPREEWLRLLNEFDIMCTPVNDYADLLTDPQVLANDYIVEVDHPGGGKMRQVNNPIRLSATPAQIRCTAPEFGQHTEEVLLEFGYAWKQIEAFRTLGAI